MADSLLLAAAFVGLWLHPFLIYVLYRWLTPALEETSTDRERIVNGADERRYSGRRIPGGENE